MKNVSLIQEALSKLEKLDSNKLLYIIDNVRYIFCVKSSDSKTIETSLLVLMINKATEEIKCINEILNKRILDEDDKLNLKKKFIRILDCASYFLSSPIKTIYTFNDFQLTDLNRQLDMYLKVLEMIKSE